MTAFLRYFAVKSMLVGILFNLSLGSGGAEEGAVVRGGASGASTSFTIESQMVDIATLGESAHFILGPAATAAICGNQQRENPEECDGTDIPKSCADYGFGAGELSCTAQCRIETRSCYQPSSGGHSTEPLPQHYPSTEEPSVPSTDQPTPPSTPDHPAASIPSEPTAPIVTPVGPGEAAVTPVPENPARPSGSGTTSSSRMETVGGHPAAQFVLKTLDHTPVISRQLTALNDYEIVIRQQHTVLEKIEQQSNREGWIVYETKKELAPGTYTVDWLYHNQPVATDTLEITSGSHPFLQVSEMGAQAMPSLYPELPLVLGPLAESADEFWIRGQAQPGSLISVYLMPAQVVRQTTVDQSGQFVLGLRPDLEFGPQLMLINERYADGVISANGEVRWSLVPAACPRVEINWGMWWIILFLLLILAGELWWLAALLKKKSHSSPLQKTQTRKKIISMLCLLMLGSSWTVVRAAEETTPRVLIYEGRIANKSGTIPSTVVMRYSLWKTTDWVTGDEAASGQINTAASTYAGWQEVQTVSLGNNGFFSVELGSVTSLPLIKYADIRYLQVEIKKVGEPDNQYELLDPTGDAGSDAKDRQAIGSSPYAKNTERIQDKELGLAENNLALLGPNGQWLIQQIPGGTNADQFIIDADNTGSGSVNLQFGSSLGKVLAYDVTAGTFYFNDDVKIAGDLNITGLINGKDPAWIHRPDTDTGTTAANFNVDLAGAVSATGSGTVSLEFGQGLNRYLGYDVSQDFFQFSAPLVIPDALTINNSLSGQLKISADNLSGTSTVTFPDDPQTTVVGENTVQTLTNKTIDGTQNNITNVPWTALVTRLKNIILTPGYAGLAVEEDGTDNLATLKLDKIPGDTNPYYILTSEQSTPQDLDLVVSWQLPNDFVSWGDSPLEINVRSTTANFTLAGVTVIMSDTHNNTVSFLVNPDLTGQVPGVWTQKSLSWTTGSNVWEPGQNVLLHLKMHIQQGHAMHVGKIKFNYNSR